MIPPDDRDLIRVKLKDGEYVVPAGALRDILDSEISAVGGFGLPVDERGTT